MRDRERAIKAAARMLAEMWPNDIETGTREECERMADAAVAAYNAALREQEDDSPEYDDLDERTAAAIAAASDHYRRVGLQPTGTIVAGRVSDILGGRTPAAPEYIPAEGELTREDFERRDYGPKAGERECRLKYDAAANKLWCGEHCCYSEDCPRPSGNNESLPVRLRREHREGSHKRPVYNCPRCAFDG